MLFVLYVVYTLTVQQVKLVNLRRQEVELKHKIELAKQGQESLQREIKLLNTEDYIEKVARDELGLIKPGEIIFKIKR